MIRGGMLVYSSLNDEWEWAIPYVHDGTQWQYAVPYGRKSGTWKMAGGAGVPLVYFIDSNGHYMTDSSGGYILVRRAYVDYFIDANGDYLCDNEGRRLAAERQPNT